MIFFKLDPPPHLAHLVRQFWLVENPDPTPVLQKIVPDGYGEIILHYGDPFRIQLHKQWEIQDRMLLSGQIRRYFFLENTGVSGMVGIKLMPAATYALFGQEMVSLTDNVVPITTVTDRIPSLAILDEALTPEERISSAQRWIETLLPDIRHREVARLSNVTDHIIEKKGMVDIESVALTHHITRRHLEREFKRVIGLSPKYFARIIQFNYIFEAMQTQDNTWVDVALNSGYFDQSHFIRNFKAFTGESPSQYGFDKQNMANFFLRK